MGSSTLTTEGGFLDPKVAENYTPHAVDLYEGDKVVKTYPSMGSARVSTNEVPTGLFVDGVQLTRTVFGEVTGLPEPQEGVLYIVSAFVATAMKGRRDDLIGSLSDVRDASGRPIGTTGFRFL